VHADREMLIPVLAGNYHSYFIHGQILFTTPSQEFLKGLRAATMTLAGMESPLVTRSVERPKPGEELVMIGPRLFTHSTSEGYEGIALGVVERIDDTDVTNLAHAAKLILEGSGEYVKLQLKGCATQILTFRREEIANATEEILEDEGIRSQYSDDLAEIFER
ncbi:MAG: hypothetical protein KDB27_19210, partial [Planctomycetales bacterium]|nr:hypothetical protein [Planctomycetales bacterium]